MTAERCPRCDTAAAPRLAWRAMHLGAYCGRCGRWLRWVPQTAEVLASAPQRPASPETRGDDPRQEALWR